MAPVFHPPWGDQWICSYVHIISIILMVRKLSNEMNWMSSIILTEKTFYEFVKIMFAFIMYILQTFIPVCGVFIICCVRESLTS